MSVPDVYLTQILPRPCIDCAKSTLFIPSRKPLKPASIMNPFRSRKKGVEGGETDVPPVPSYSRTFKRNKKSAPEPKQPAVDIATALPPSDDFRTSLLMPNLSARFSMLREQDDPTSKIGKANDDSVLFPKRASRLNLFYRNELTDIAEVASLNGSIRPAFASTKANSYGSSDGYGTDDGYLMNRPRPGEGNNLFGGRQKIYRIAVGARSSSGDEKGNGVGDWSSGKGMSGRALYGDDVASSAFTRPAQPDKQDSPEISSEPPSVRSSQAPQSSDSPLFNHNNKRETTSSTTSVQVESRTSTAATSVASQRSVNGIPGSSAGSPQPTRVSASVMANPPSMDRQATKSRRLYGQGLDQHIHDQQSSAMHRLESLQRQRALGATSLPRKLSQPRSGHNLQDRYQRSAASNVAGPHRAASPPASGSPSRLREFDLGLPAGPPSATSQPELAYFRSPPLSPPMSPVPDPKLVAALEPTDIGKATALGAFNKPSKQFDEQQYLERQIQLQQRRHSPPMAHPLSPMAVGINQPKADRSRSHSPVSPLSRSNSLETKRPRDLGMGSVSEIHQGDKKEYPSNDATQPDLGDSFFSAETPSDIGSPLTDTRPGGQISRQASSTDQKPLRWILENSRPEKPRDMDHPIHRQRQEQQQDRTHLPYSSGERVAEYSREIKASQIPEKNSSVDQGKRTVLNADSPTLGPANEVTGLNGLVHTHLRNDSGQSSIYPEPSPPLELKTPDDFRRENSSSNHDPEGRSSETFFRKSTWEDVGIHGKQPIAGAVQQGPVAVPPPLSLRARHVLEQAAALQNHTSPKVQQMLGLEKSDRSIGSGAPRRKQDGGSGPGWQEQLKTHHTRGGSTETEKERESLANELAERRRMVQDNLKSFVENESRSNSPMPGNRALDRSPSKPGTSFGILRSKTSKGTMAAKPEQPTKAMKMLGISVGPGTSNGGGSLHLRQERFLEQGNEHATNHSSYDLRIPAHNPRPALQDSRQHSHPMFAQRRVELQLNNRHQELLARRSPPQPQPKPSSREDRSNSDSSDKDGRNGGLANSVAQDRDVHLGHHPSGAPARTYGNFSRPSAADHGNTTIASSLGERSQPAGLGRFRSNSNNKANAPGAGYIESRGNLPRYPSSAHTSPPGSTHSSLSTPSYEPSPNASNMTTPFMMAPSSYSVPAARLPSDRKRSINKHDISDPTFISSTSSMSTVDLPPGASLNNGMDSVYSGASVGEVPPPIPPINPRRRRTQTLRQALGRLDKPEGASRPSTTSQPDLSDERSRFSADESEVKVRYRTRLRKTSSEGGNMNLRARQQMMLEPSPAMPPYPQSHSAGPSPAISHFPRSMPAGGPATGGMF